MTATIPVRAAIALSGAGSLGTFLAGAARELLSAVRRHNLARHEDAGPDDPRILNPRWGHITIDAVGGSSAGAIVGSQIVKALYEPRYAGEGKRIDALGTLSGDWIHGASFERLSPAGNEATQSGPVEAPGWTVLSGAYLYDLSRTLLEPARTISARDRALRDGPDSPLDPSGIVATGITLTDLLGYHEPAEFEPDAVLGHPQFGCPAPSAARRPGEHGSMIRDLGGRGHAEVRKVFVARDREGFEHIHTFLRETLRRGAARGVTWSSQAAVRLASLCAASASLPLAIGPVALTDRAAELEVEVRRLYLDGGTLNNRPIAPALRLGRWHDELRLHGCCDDAGHFSVETIREQLVYERVVFTLDAFPDHSRNEWRSPHPSEAFLAGHVPRLRPKAVEARNVRIDAALEAPTHAFGVFFQSVMSSLRAHDIRNIAKLNRQLAERDQWIAQQCAARPEAPASFRVDSFERAAALAHVLRHPASAELSDDELRGVAYSVWSMDRYAGRTAHRPVTMIPVYAPQDMKEVLAGDAAYAVAGLLSQDARRHDANVGATAARQVLGALHPAREVEPIHLESAPEHVRPHDSDVLMKRLQVAFGALVDANLQRSGTLRFFAKVPVHLRPLVSGVKRRLDRAVVRKVRRD